MKKEMYLGLDIGGTKTAAGLVSKEGALLKKTEVPTEVHKGLEGLLENIKKAVLELAPEKIYGTGIGFAGQIDSKKGEVIYSPNMPTFRNVPLVKGVCQTLEEVVEMDRCHVVVDNDANAFSLAEHRVGKGKGTQHFVGVTVGTGVGGGIIINGELYHGQAFATELGHMIIEIDGRDAPTGISGELEAYCSGLSIQRMYYEKTGKNKAAFDIELDALKDNNSPDHYVYLRAGKALGIGLANIVNIFDPEMIVIGGGVGRSDLLVDIARDFCHKNTFYKGRKTKIEKSDLSNDAAIIGTAMLAM